MQQFQSKKNIIMIPSFEIDQQHIQNQQKVTSYKQPLKVFIIIIIIFLFFLLIGYKRSRDPLIHFNKGLQFIYNSNFMKAMNSFTKAIQLKKQYKLAFIYRAQAFQNLGYIQKARQDYQMAINIKQNNQTENQQIFLAYYKSARFHMRQLNGEQARKNFKQALKYKPNEYYVYYYYGLLLQNYFNQTQRAFQKFDICLQKLKYYDPAYLQKGNILMLENKTQKALELYTKAIKLNPMKTRYYLKRAEAYQRIQKKDLAQADYIKSRNMGFKKVRFDKSFYLYGKFLVREQRLKQAINEFSESINIGKNASDLCKNEVSYKYLSYIARSKIYKQLNETKKGQKDEMQAEKIIKERKKKQQHKYLIQQIQYEQHDQQDLQDL